MKFHDDAGLWVTGPEPEPVPLTSVLEICGAVLAWTVDDPAGRVRIAFTDPSRADWLWRIVGANGHSAVVAALQGAVAGAEVDVPGVGVDPAPLSALRHLALGHWLRRWWPASRRDGIAELDGALLDGELALLTARAQEFFDDEAFDADVAGLLRPHAATLSALVRHDDSRVRALAQSCAELAGDLGLAVVGPAGSVSAGRRDDYALVAGSAGSKISGAAVAAGVGSINWAAVPSGIFDAAEDTIDWQVESDGATVNAVVRTDVQGPRSPAGIAVRVRSGRLSGTAALDGSGTAAIPLADGDGPATDAVAWDHDWSAASVSVGADVTESRLLRDRVRVFARARLLEPGDDAFLAEVLAAEADY